MKEIFSRLYGLLSDSGFLDIAYPIIIVTSVVVLVITIFNCIKITIISITNTIKKKKNENGMKFGEQIDEVFGKFGAAAVVIFWVSVLSVPVFLIVRKALQLLGQLIDWLLV
jgi:hypothetical protein